MFCPECRSEYRAGITTCKSCGDVALVDSLPEIRALGPEEPTLPVGMSGERGFSRVIEVEGRTVDLAKTFAFEFSTELARALEEENIPSLLREVEGIEFPDRRPHFEVHVRPEDHTRAEALLHQRWRELGDIEDAAVPEDPEKCPACGAQVPLDVEECPECGLNVGRGEAEAEA